jgi:hypothetical protein
MSISPTPFDGGANYSPLEWSQQTTFPTLCQSSDHPSVVFAHKTTEGWEALLNGMIKGGWVITGSWPVATEMASRLRARESAALATSVHLICRPRAEDAETGDWGDVLRELPNRIGNWIEQLSAEGAYRGPDFLRLANAFSGPCIPKTARRNGCSMLCSWRCPDRNAPRSTKGGTGNARCRRMVLSPIERPDCGTRRKRERQA